MNVYLLVLFVYVCVYVCMFAAGSSSRVHPVIDDLLRLCSEYCVPRSGLLLLPVLQVSQRHT